MMWGNNPGTGGTATLIPQNSVGAELGVWMGDSSEKFLRNAAHVHLVDSWSPAPYAETDEWGSYENYLERYSALAGGKTTEDFQRFYDKVYQSVVDRFAGRPVTIHRMTTDEWFATFTEKLDWIYIDASHAYDACLRDLHNAKTVLKPNGIIFGDDYSNKKPGVKKAVDTFISETGLEMNNFYMDQYIIQLKG